MGACVQFSRTSLTQSRIVGSIDGKSFFSLEKLYFFEMDFKYFACKKAAGKSMISLSKFLNIY